MHKTLVAAVLALLLPTSAVAQTRAFGQVQGWETAAEFHRAEFLGCGAGHPGGSGFVGLALNAVGEWWMVMGFVGVRGEQRAQLAVDGLRLADRMARGDGYTTSVLLTPEDRAALGAGARLRVELAGGGHAEWSLSGSEAAMAMVGTCVARRGRAG